MRGEVLEGNGGGLRRTRLVPCSGAQASQPFNQNIKLHLNIPKIIISRDLTLYRALFCFFSPKPHSQPGSRHWDTLSASTHCASLLFPPNLQHAYSTRCTNSRSRALSRLLREAVLMLLLSFECIGALQYRSIDIICDALV